MDSVVIEPGDHLFYPCKPQPHQHYGIYCGNITHNNIDYYDVVVHLEGKRKSGFIRAISYNKFALNRDVYVKKYPGFCYSADIVVQQALYFLDAVDYPDYDLALNNCEHFCNLCKTGKHKSYQVESLLLKPTLSSFFAKHSYAKVRGRKRHLNNTSNHAEQKRDTDIDFWIVECSHCDRKNRLPKYYQGSPICGQCKSPLFG